MVALSTFLGASLIGETARKHRGQQARRRPDSETNRSNTSYFLESSYLATADNMETQMFLVHTLPLGPCIYSPFRSHGHQTWIVVVRGSTSCARTWDGFWAMPARDMIGFQISNGSGFTASVLIQSYRFP